VRLALESVTYDGSVIALDREQAPLKLTFTSFVAKRVTPKRVARGKQVMAEHGEVLGRITSRFHVAPEVLVAIWGLETDYGANAGTTPSMQALATLAYDCRRAPRFRDELVHALRIVERGDLTADELYGAWAGELGQTQFLPSSYDELGVDFDGDGRVDMVRSAADALASTAHFLEAAGWRPGERYEPGTPNFIALRKWNASEMYCKTIVLFASKLVGP
jgi:lytic murein transglycosylase